MSGHTKAQQPVTSPSTTYGASYPHCSLWRPLHAACGCCLHPPSGLGPGRHRSWPRSTGGLIPDRCERTGTHSNWVRDNSPNAKQEATAEDDEDDGSYSLVSRVTMMRIGRLFIPPTQLELHMKLYKIVVNSVPTWERKMTLSEWQFFKSGYNRKLENVFTSSIIL